MADGSTPPEQPGEDSTPPPERPGEDSTPSPEPAGGGPTATRESNADRWVRYRASGVRHWDRFRESGGLRWLAAGAVVLLLLFGTTWFTCAFQGCPDPEALLAYEPGGAPIILDREGEEFAMLLPVQREIVDFDSLPPHVSQAFIAVEDRRFRDHGGVDIRRIGGALLANIREGGVAEGGSTITVQLARNAFPDHLPASQRTFTRKLGETRVALKIEDEFDKDAILGLYLNQIYFGNGATGIAAASRHYFSIPPSELRVEQAALLAGMVKAPAHYDPREDPDEAHERRNLVLDLMHEAGYLSAEEHREARETEIDVIPRSEAADVGESLRAPWFLEAIRRTLEEEIGPDVYRTQVRVHSTLDPRLQAAAEEALDAQLRQIESGRFGTYEGAAYDPASPPQSAGSAYLQGAVVVLEPTTGDVMALVGGRNYRHSTFDHVSDGDRQVGSAFKPFVYGAAVAAGVPPSRRIDDTPLSIEMRGSPTYRPVNYDGGFDGPMTAREALRRSRNVPTVRLGQEIGTDAVAEFAERAGVDAEIPRGPSMVLGTVTLSPMELARAFATFASLGRAAEPRLIRRVETVDGEVLWESEVEDEERIEPRVAYVLNDMLTDVIDGGTGSAARAAGFRGTAAGKTGTTQENADTWFVGYTPEVVGVVWLGFDQPKAILSNASGGTLAAPIWGRMMAGAGRSGAEWEQPDGVVRLPYDPATGNALPRDCHLAAGAPTDLFLRGEEGPMSCPSRSAWDTLGDSFGAWGDTLYRDTSMLDSLRLRDDYGFDSVRTGDPVRGGQRDTIRIDTGRRDTTEGDIEQRDTVRRDTDQDTERRDTERRDTEREDTERQETDTIGGGDGSGGGADDTASVHLQTAPIGTRPG